MTTKNKPQHLRLYGQGNPRDYWKVVTKEGLILETCKTRKVAEDRKNYYEKHHYYVGLEVL